MKIAEIVLLIAMAVVFAACNTVVGERAQSVKEDVEAATGSHIEPTQVELEAVKEPCDDAQTTTEIADCENGELKKADAELNRTYQIIVNNLQKGAAKVSETSAYSKRNLENLQTTQRAWLKYRDANCKTENDLYEGGSMQQFIGTICERRLTEQRTEEIKVIFQNSTVLDTD